MGARFFSGGGGGGGKFFGPNFYCKKFSKTKIQFFFSKTLNKLINLCFLEKKMKKNRQYEVKFVFSCSCAL
jgi:hypothetical protein